MNKGSEGPDDGSLKRDVDDPSSMEIGEHHTKMSPGPNDGLNLDSDSEEEFTPFTQSRPDEVVSDSTSKMVFEEIPCSVESGEQPSKRPRGPYDCLNWDSDSEEEFTPFTQPRPYPHPTAICPPTVFAKKSSETTEEGSKNRKRKKGKTKGEFLCILFL
jgi:hypothetical protein